MDKKIIIDGVEYNPCNGCKLWNGHHCIGARSYEPNADKHRAICNEHIANQFHKVYQQLYRKTQECEELKKKLRDLELKNTILQNRYQQLDGAIIECGCYRKALEEIEGIAKNFGSYAAWQEQRINKILDIINKAKGEGICQ